MSISSELLTLNNTKTAIRTAINSKGGSVEASAPFASYATAIDNLPTGGGNKLLTSIDVSDFSGTTFNEVATYITSATIPSGVTSIVANAFIGSGLTSITIPNSVTSIGDMAFKNSRNLTSVSLPGTISSFGSSLFDGCSKLASLDLSNNSNLTTVPEYTCNYCTLLASAKLPPNITSVGPSAFNNCTSLQSITIPSGVTSLGARAFYKCSGLSSIICYAATPPTIGFYSIENENNCPIYVPAASVDTYKAASGWSTYASRIYPIQQVATVDGNPVYNYEIGDTDGIVMGSGDMANMPTGTSLELAEGITSVQGVINGYTTVSLPSTMSYLGVQEVIGSSVTTLTCLATTPPTVQVNNLGGSGLTAIYVPYGYGSTYQAASGWSTFSSIIQELPAPPKAVLTLTNNTVVNVPGDGTTRLSKNNVTAVATITDIASAVVNEGITATSGSIPTTGAFSGATNLSSVTLPSTLTEISGHAFRNTALASIYIPENVESIAPAAFENCPLASITVDANNSTYTSRNNCNAVIYTAYETLVLGCSSTVIDTDVVIIGSSAFKGRTSLTSVTIPDGALAEIQNNAFYGCTNLTSVTCMATTPPTLYASVFDNTNDCPIYVPAEAVEDYAGDWVDYEDRIQAIPSA